jgi:Flp pilus assembly protein TadG
MRSISVRTAKNSSPGICRQCRGAAAVEFAILLPLLALLLVGIVDFSRLFYHHTIITNCARNGALYASDRTAEIDSPHYNPADREASIRAAARADAVGLVPEPMVTFVETGTNVAVTVTYQFNMITGYLGFGSVTLIRTVRMNHAPNVPG